MSDIGVSGGSCAGFFQGNLLGGSPGKVDEQEAALEELGFLAPVNWDAVNGTKVEPGDVKTFSFKTALYGDTIIALHFGAAKGAAKSAAADGLGVQSTGFYRFDAGNTGLTSLTVFYQGLSNAVVYSTANGPTAPPPIVPEPATWAMMLGGFGLLGGAMRRRRGVRHVHA